MTRPAEQPVNRAGSGPELPPLAPRRPRWLRGYARAEWRRLVRILEPLGYLTLADQQPLAALCQAVREMREATETLDREGRTFQTDTGYLMPHPAVAAQRSAMGIIRAYSALFGLDPSSRGKLPTPKRKAAAGVQARKRG